MGGLHHLQHLSRRAVAMSVMMIAMMIAMMMGSLMAGACTTLPRLPVRIPHPHSTLVVPVHKEDGWVRLEI